MAAGLRLAWLAVASVLLVFGLGAAFEANADGTSRFSATTFLVYTAFVAALGLVTYGLHRRAPRTPPGASAARAFMDTLLAAVIGAPVLFGVVVIAATLRDCATGSGC